MAEIKISLAAARVNAGMTQEEVAKKMQVSKSTIINWEKGKKILGVAQLYFLSNLYKIPIENIFLPFNSTLSKLDN